MESDLQRPSDHAGINIGDHGEEHHEHKSVLKKVKDKAKKIKDTIKKHGHSHEHEHDEGGDDYAEETVNDPHDHGAPMHDPALNKSPNLPRDTNINVEKQGFGRDFKHEQNIIHEGIDTSGPLTHEGIPKPITPGMITHDGKPVSPGPIKHEGTVSPGPIKHEGMPRPVAPGPIKHEGMHRPVTLGPDGHEEMPRPVGPGIFMHEGMAKPTSPVPLAEAFGKRPAMAARDTGDENSPKPKKNVGLETDPQSPAGISKSNYQSKVVDPTGDGGKEANVTPLVGQFGNLNVLDEKPEQEQSPYHHTGTNDMFAPQKSPTKNLSHPDSNRAYTPETENPDPSPMIQDPTTITGKITGAAISAKNAVASKLGYGDTPTAGLRPEHENPNPSPKTQDSTNPQNTITGKISGTAISAKNMVASKLGYGETTVTGIRPEHEIANQSPKIQDSTNPPNTITGKISGTAISAKDAVASKLGYGGTAAGGLRPERHLNPNPSPNTQDSTNPNTITGKISGTAISAKDAVASKLGYGVGSQAGQGHASGPGGETGTMKDYLAEKLRPGDEDKALSEVITGAFSKKDEAPVMAVVEQPGSRVKVSPEVAARLGPATESKREGEDALAAGAESSGPGVVGRLKDAVGGWLGKSDGVQTAQDSIEGSYVGDASATSGGGAKRES